MTPEQTLARADAAQRILNDPLVVEALATIEKEVVEAFFACPTRDLEGMRILQTDLRLARQFRGILQSAIEKGKLTAHDLREKESFLQQAVRKIRP